ncbi:hypothetical protein V8E53_007199 [Lactarius tabidus]
MADDARSLAPRRRPYRPILVVANPSPDSDSDSTNEPSSQRPDGHVLGRNAPPSPSQPSPSIDKSSHVQLVSSREPGPLTTTNLPSSHFRQHPASQSNPALSSPSGTSSPPPSTPGQSLPPSDFVPDAPTKLDFSFGPSNSPDALAQQQQHVPLHVGSASHLLGKIKAHIPRMHHDRRLSNSSRQTSSPTAATPSELDGSRAMNDGRSLDKSLTRIFVTGDSDQYYTVDITGFRNAAFIKELIFSKLRIEDEEQTRYSIYRTEIGAYAIGDALPDEQLYELCRDNGDAKGSLKFLVANSSAVVHERNQPAPIASPNVSSIQPPVLIPSNSNSMYNRPHPRRSRSRHGSVSSAASERLELINCFDLSLSDDQNGADAESHRSTLRAPPKPYAVSSQNLVPPSPRGSRKPSEPRNGSPARSNTRAHSPFLSPDRSGPHSPDLRRGRPNAYSTLPQQQPRPGRASPERSHPVCDDRAFNGGPGTSPHGRSGSDPAAERERSEIQGDSSRLDERMPGKRRIGAGKKELESSKLNREPSWVIVGQEGARLPRVGREPKSSPHYQSPNSTLSRPPGIPHVPRQQPPPPPGGEQRSSGRQAVPPGWAVRWNPASGDSSSPGPPYNLKMAKSMGSLRDKGGATLTSAKSRPAGPVPPLPMIMSSGNSTPTKDGTPTSLTVTGDVVGPSSEREAGLSMLNEPPKAQAEPSRPLLRVSPTNSRPIRPLPQKAPGQPLPEVAVTAASPQPSFPLSSPAGLSKPTNSTQGTLSTQPDPITRPRSVLDEESMSQQPPPRLQRPVDSSVFSEPLQESDPLRSPLPPSNTQRFPRQLPPVSREDSGSQPTTRVLPIPGGTPAMDDRSPDIRPSSLNEGNPTPASRTPPRSPISPRNHLVESWERIGSRPDLATSVSVKTCVADAPWGQSRSRDLIDFNKPAEQTIMRDDNTLKEIQHLLDGQSSSDEATMVKPKTFVLPPIPPPPPLQAPTLRKIGYVPPPPPLPKPPPVPFPVARTPSNIYSPHTPLSPDSHPSDQDGSDSEAGTLWQKPMIEDDSLADGLKSNGRGPPLTVKIDEQSSASQMKSSSSSGGGLTIIPNNFPPPPKHPPPSPPLPHRGSRTPTARQLHRKPSKSESTFQDSSWASRPNPEEVLNKLELFFPDHDLDKPVIEASSGGTSPTAVEYPPAPLPYNGRAADKRSRHKKSIRVVAEEHNLRQDRTSRLQSTTAANIFRKRSTKLWDSRVEEVTPGQITSGMPSIPDSPSVSGSGTTAPKPIFKWVRGELIGKGNFGRVYLALNATTGEMIAVKQVEIPRTASDKNDSRQVTVVEALKLESETLKDLDHPNIVQYLGFEETPNFLSIFLEYVPGGSVGSCLRKYGRFEHNVTKYFTEQILAGLEYLHLKGILHRDLKADNILVEKTGICKISDFGISKRTDDINEQNVLTAMQGTVFWMAPEVVNTGKRGYNAKVDIWSVGCVVLEMWAGERPWRKEEAMAVIVKLYSSKQAPPIPSGIILDDAADDFRTKCFAINPDERPSAADLRKHHFLQRPQGWAFTGLSGSYDEFAKEGEVSDEY